MQCIIYIYTAVVKCRERERDLFQVMTGLHIQLQFVVFCQTCGAYMVITDLLAVLGRSHQSLEMFCSDLKKFSKCFQIKTQYHHQDEEKYLRDIQENFKVEHLDA